MFSPSSKRADNGPCQPTQTTGRSVRSATFHVRPPSIVREIVPGEFRPVPSTPWLGSRNAIAFGTRVARDGGSACISQNCPIQLGRRGKYLPVPTLADQPLRFLVRDPLA